MPRSMRSRFADGETLIGTFLALGSAAAAEVVARAGMDFVVVDLEHGLGTESDVLAQLVAAERGGAHGLVRVESPARERTTRVLDMGAEGVLCPRVESAEQARQWVRAFRYDGTRGVALTTRGAGYGLGPAVEPVGVAQIESRAGVEACDEIARVEGVDLLFVGPTDLSHDLGCFRRWDAPELRDAMARVAAAATRAGKVAGTYCRDRAGVEAALGDGFRFVAMSGDVGMLAGAAATVRRT